MNLKIWHLASFAIVIIIVVVVFLPNDKEQGVLLARSGRVEQAARKLEEVLRENPTDIKTVQELANGYLSANQVENAITVYKVYMKSGGNNKKIIDELTRLYISNYQYEDAVALLSEDKDRNLNKLIELAVKMGELKKAVEYSRDKLALLGNNSPERVETLKNIEKYEAWQLNLKGVAETKEAIAKEENTLEGNLQALDYFVWKNNIAKIKVYAEKVATFKNIPIDNLRLLRTAWIRVKDAKNAIKTAKKITTMSGAEFSDWDDYMTLLEWTGKKEELAKAIDKLLIEYPDNVDLYWRELAILPNDGRSEKRALIDEKLYALTGDVGLVRDAALIYTNLANEKKVLELYNKLLGSKEFIKRASESIEDKLFLVDIYEKTGDKKKAAEIFAEIYPQLVGRNIDEISENSFWSALAYTQQSNRMSMNANLLVSFYRKTSDIQMLRDARDIYRTLNLDKQTLAIDKRLLAMEELSPYEMLEMSKTYARMGKSTESSKLAKELYNLVLSDKELVTDEDTYWSALDASEAEGDLLVRAKILQKFYKITHDPELLRAAAEIYKQAGMYNEQLSVYNVLEDSKLLTNYDIGELLAVYERLGMEKELEKLTSEVYAKVMKSQTYDKEENLFYVLVDLLPRMGRDEDRLKLIEKYAEHGDVEAKILLAGIYRDSQMLDEAKKELEGIIADKKTSEENREQAELQLAYIVSTEFYNAEDPKLQMKIMSVGGAVVDKVIKNLKKNMFTLTGDALSERENIIDEFKVLQIRFAFLKEDYIEVDQLLTELYNPDSGIYLDLASLFLNSGEEDTAKRYFKKVVDTVGFTEDQYSLLGFMYLSFEDYDKALSAYMKADRKANGLNKDVRIGLSEVYGKLGEEEKQYKIVDFYTSFKNSTPEDWVRAADARVEHSDLVGELKVLEKAVERRPDSAILVARIVSRLIGFGKNIEAVSYAKKLEGLKVLKEENDLITVGYGLLDVGQVREAGRMFAVASNIDNKSKDAKLALARYFVACFQYPEAHRIYKSYLKENPDDPRVWYEYAVLKRAAGFVGSREAFFTSKRFFQDGKQGAEEMSFISSIDFYLNRRDSALARAKYATQLASEDEVYALNLAEMYNSYNYPEYGKLVAESVVENDFNSSRRNGLVAEAELMSRRFIEGIDELKKVLLKRNDDSAAQLAKGYSEVEIGEWIDGAEDLMIGEIKNNMEEEKRALLHQNRATKSMFDNVKLPSFED